MVIAFVHDHASFLPEIHAYQRFFNQHSIRCITTDFRSDDINADVLWYIMGFRTRRRKDAVIIHEYTSASAPPYAQVKNAAKRWLNARPDFRLFLNEYVKEQLAFTDGVRSGCRDMGVDLSVFSPKKDREVLYDFIYVGNVHRSRKINRLIECFTAGDLRHRSLLVLSSNYEKLEDAYSSASNIRFKGPVAADEVATYINQSAFAVNYIPDEEPFNHQTSTKLLEYAACGVPVISTSYAWVKDFRKRYGGSFFFLENDLSNFSWNAVNNFRYEFPDLSSWQWDQQILKSGVMQFLKERLPFS